MCHSALLLFLCHIISAFLTDATLQIVLNLLTLLSHAKTKSSLNSVFNRGSQMLSNPSLVTLDGPCDHITSLFSAAYSAIGFYNQEVLECVNLSHSFFLCPRNPFHYQTDTMSHVWVVQYVAFSVFSVA